MLQRPRRGSALSLILAALALASGCASVLGLEDPKPGTGDGGVLTLESIAVSPSLIPVGETVQLSASGMYSDRTTSDLTSQATFAVVAGGALTVTAAGAATAVQLGSATLRVTVGEVMREVTVQVVTAAPRRLAFSLSAVRAARLQVVRLKVTAELTDGTMIDATPSAQLTTTEPAIATASAGTLTTGAMPGAASISASIAGAQSATLAVTVEARDCTPVINELMTGTVADADNEWVELYNPCTAAAAIGGWTLVYRGPSSVGALDSSTLYSFPAATSIPAGEWRIYSGPGYGSTADGSWISGAIGGANGAVGLRSGPASTGPLVDSLAYGTVSASHPFLEGAAVGAMVPGQSAQRLPYDGRDENRGLSDFAQGPPATPRAANAP
jgi:hypothetical protein